MLRKLYESLIKIGFCFLSAMNMSMYCYEFFLGKMNFWLILLRSSSFFIAYSPSFIKFPSYNLQYKEMLIFCFSGVPLHRARVDLCACAEFMPTFTRRTPRRTQTGGSGGSEISRFFLLIYLVYVLLHFTQFLVFMHLALF